MEHQFPLYRMYKNGRSFFKVLSPHAFIEIQIMGKKYFFYTIEAKTLPDFNLLNDLIENYHHHWEQITEAEFNSVLSHYEAQ